MSLKDESSSISHGSTLSIATTTTTTTTTTDGRWASLADRLNPNRAAYDPQLKASWNTMSKVQRKRVIQQDEKAIRALKERGKTPLPYETDPDDHCETSSIAYSHIVPILTFLAWQLEKSSPNELKIYDPYYCAGATVQHLQSFGFDKVYNRPEDFYKVIQDGRVPSHDVVVTNPPYSGDHFDRLLSFLKDNGKPFLLLLPDHFAQRPSYTSATWLQDSLLFLTPPQRYHYWTPEGRREETENPDKNITKKRKHANLYLGARNSPFNSLWFVSLEPVLKRKKLLKAYARGGRSDDESGNRDKNKKKQLQLAPGCVFHKDMMSAKESEQSFRGGEGVLSQHPSRKRDKKNKRKKK